MASLIPDSIKDTLGDLVDTYSQIQTLKLKRDMAKTQASLSAYDLANISQDQAASNANKTPVNAGNNKALIVGAAIVGAVALYLVLK